MLRTIVFALVLAVFLPSAGASDVADTPAPDAAMTAEELVALAADIQKEVERLRGWTFKHPVATNIRSEEELREYLLQELFEVEYPGDRMLRIQASLQTVGLLPPDADMKRLIVDVLMNQVAGFYDPPSKAFYMVEMEGANFSPVVNRILIAHEMTHALDDQYVDLDALIHDRERSEDGDFAIMSVVEGSATMLMTRYITDLQMSGQLGMGELTEVMENEAERSKPFLEAPPYFRGILAHYTCGMLWLVDGNMMAVMNPAVGEQIRTRVLAATEAPPQSSEQILHPEKYWDDGKRDPPARVRDEEAEGVFEKLGLHVLHRDVLGEALMAMVTSDPDAPFNMMAASALDAWTNRAATGWGGDRFYLLSPTGKLPPVMPEGHGFEEGSPDANPSGKPMTRGWTQGLRGVWITTWDTATDRDEFVTAYEGMAVGAPRETVVFGDRSAAFLYGMLDDEAAVVRTAIGAGEISFRQDDALWTP